MDLETDLKETASLRSLAQICLENLRQLRQDEKDGVTGEDTADEFWSTRQLAEFSLWCANVGVNLEGLRSLDVRLKDVPETSSILLQLLRALNSDLEDLTQPQANTRSQPENSEGRNGNNDDDDDSEGSLTFNSLSSSDASDTGAMDAPTRSQELRQHISDTIDRLHGQARRIERASAQHRRNRVEVYRQKERPNQVFQGYRELGVWKAKEQFKTASEPFQQRIGESFARRRIRFEYLAKHQRKRAVDVVVVTKPTVVEMATDDNNNTESLGHKKPRIPGVNNGPLMRTNRDQKTILSATIATKFDTFPEPIRQEKAESVKSIALRHHGFPPAPQTLDGRFQCPYCFLDFRDSEAEKARWSQHVMHDFEPYFCTFEDCPAPFDVPNSFDGLLAHMQSHLPVRYHISDSALGHKELNEQDFEDHVRRHGEITEKDMIDMKEASRRKGAFIFEICPFCGGYPDVLEKIFPDRDSVDAQRALRGHIKQHMQEIALFLPPYRSDIQEDDSSHGSVATNRRSNIDKAENDPNDFVELCNRAECDCRTPGRYASDNIEKVFSTHDLEATKEVDWANILEGFTDYARENAEDEDLTGDGCLYPFILRFALMQDDDVDGESALVPWGDSGQQTKYTLQLLPLGAVEQRIKDVLRLLKAKFGDPTNLDPLRAAKDDVTAIQYLLAHQNAEIPEDQLVLWMNINKHARNGSLSYVRQHLGDFAELNLSEDTNAPQSSSRVVFELDMTQLQILQHEADSNYSLDAFYKQNPVWIEWKEDMYRSPTHVVPNLRALASIRDLVWKLHDLRSLLRSEIVVIPNVLGFVKNEKEDKIGVVIEKPQFGSATKDFVSLQLCLDIGSPDIEMRKQLIHALRSVIVQLHTAGHLHGDLRSSNIFLSKPPNLEIVDLTWCFLLGFDVENGELTNDEDEDRPCDPQVQVYRHPDSKPSDQYPFQHEMYSLGLLLLEIVYWKPIYVVMGLDSRLMGPEPVDREQLREALRSWVSRPQLDADLNWVVERFDRDIGGIIQACLKGDTSVSSEGSEQLLSSYFKNDPPLGAFTNSQIKEIDILLNLCNKIAHGNPRTYIVLRMMGRLDLLDQFLGMGFNDYFLPMHKDALSNFLPSPSAEQFFDRQRHILSDPGELSTKSHRHFAHDKDAPFAQTGGLREGKIATVHFVESTRTKMLYARKTRDRTFVHRHESNMEDFLEELKVLRRLCHKHLIQFVGSYSSMTTLQILLTAVAVAGGDLASYMKNNAKSESRMILQHFYGCLTNAIHYLHSERIWHWCLNPQNIVIYMGTWYISGFSQSVDVSSRGVMYLEGPCESDPYSAPEIGAIELVNASADIWSLGCIFLEISITLQGEAPEQRINRFRNSSSNSFIYRRNPILTTQLLDEIELKMSEESLAPLSSIRSMLQFDKRARPTAAELMRMIKMEDKGRGKLIGSCCATSTVVEHLTEASDYFARAKHQSFSPQGDVTDSDESAQHEVHSASTEDSRASSPDPSPAVDGA